MTSFRYRIAQAAELMAAQTIWWEGLLSFYAARAVDVAEIELKLAMAGCVWDAARITSDFRRRAAELGVLVPDRRVPDEAPNATQRERVAWVTEHVMLRNLDKVTVALAHCEPLADEPSARLLAESREVLTRHMTVLKTIVADASIPWGEQSSVGPPRDPRLTPSGPRKAIDPKLEVLHRNFTDIELPTIEQSAAAIGGFQDMPSAFVLDMARQCWDEARHARLFRDRLEALGGTLGDVECLNSLWDMCSGRPLALQLAINQRWGEWSGVCGARWQAERFRSEGDTVTSQIFEYVLADETLHVAAGNRWIRYLVPDAAARVLLDAEAAAVRRAAGRSAPPDATFPFHRDLCERCGFEQADVDLLERHYGEMGSRMLPVKGLQ